MCRNSGTRWSINCINICNVRNKELLVGNQVDWLVVDELMLKDYGPYIYDCVFNYCRFSRHS
jgi:hypothetical protein